LASALARRLFWALMGLTTVLKIYFAWVVPIIGDESYYVQWAMHPALGYFDHPPASAWMITPLLVFGEHPVVLRLPAILLSPLMAISIVWFLKGRVGEERAYWGALLFLLAPLHALGFFLGVDIPLILFSLWAVMLYARALEEPERSHWGLLSGACLGLAFLGKYFAVFVGVGIAAHALYWFRDRRVWKALGLLLLGCAPFVAIHLYFNLTHCWATFHFHTHGRDAGQGYHPRNVQAYGWHQLYLLGPALLLAFVFYGRRVLRAAAGDFSRGSLFGLTYFVPLLIFLYFSFRMSLGLHWTLAFYPLFYVLIACVLGARELRILASVMGVYALIHGVGMLGLTWIPLETWKDKGFYNGLLFSKDAPEIARAMASEAPESVMLMSDGYSEASLLETFSRRRFGVFGGGVLFGRQDDIWTDFSALDTRDIWIVTRHGRAIEEYAPYFAALAREKRSARHSSFYVFRGVGFKYSVYREHVLKHVREMHYRVPSRYPMLSCYFLDRYYPGETSR
jgi:hypothetical protein